MLSTEEILNNVVWLVDALDEDALDDVQDIPLLEMAQAVTISPSQRGNSRPQPVRRKRVRPRYPTSMKAALIMMNQAAKTTERRLLL